MVMEARLGRGTKTLKDGSDIRKVAAGGVGYDNRRDFLDLRCNIRS